MPLPRPPHYHSPAPASAPASPSATAPAPGLRIRSAVQHHDDFPASAAQPAADQHQPAADQHAARHRSGHLHAGSTDPVGRQRLNLKLKPPPTLTEPKPLQAHMYMQ